MPRRVLALILLLSPAFAAGAPDRFVRTSVEQGLSQSTVQAILQDHLGFMWFGTEEGLNRYDGYTFVVYKHDARDPKTLQDDVVSALFEDRQGRLWVGTEHGLSQFDRRTESFSPVAAIGDRVTCMVEDRDGTLWVAAQGGGLFLLPAGASVFRSYQPDPRYPTESLSSFAVSSLFCDHLGRIWVGTMDKGVDLFIPSGAFGKFVHHRHDPGNRGSLSNDEIWGLSEDRAGHLWVATYGGGIDVLDEKTGEFRHYRHDLGSDPRGLATDATTSIFADRGGTLWVGTDGGGLLHYDEASDRFVAYLSDPAAPPSLSRNVIRTIYEDRQGQIWVGTFLGGVDLLSNPSHQFGYIGREPGNEAGLAGSQVSCFCEDPGGKIWLGTEEGWLNRFDPATGNFERYRFPSNFPSGPALLAIHQDRRGRIWVGTYRFGLSRFDPQTGQFVVFRNNPDDPKSIANDEVWAIAEDSGGALWLGTNEGLDRFDPDRGEVVTHYKLVMPGGPRDASVRALIVDRSGAIWAGTFGGLCVLSPGAGSFRIYRHDDGDPASLSTGVVVSLCEDSRGSLWIGTLGGGLNLFDPSSGKFKVYRDFASNVINATEEDSTGKLWLSTNHGLIRFDPDSGNSDAFDLTNGLQNLQFHLGAGARTRNGHLLFGSVEGFYYFDPVTIRPEQYAPPVSITGFNVFDEPLKLPAAISTVKAITLSPADKVFSIEFAALDFRFPRRNRYVYQMEGFSDRWVEIGAKREVTFTNLDPGAYTFRVRASNSDGVWSDASGASLRIDVLPPLWRTWWFRVLAASLFVIGLFSAHRLRLRRLTGDLAERKRTELILRTAEEKYRELVEDIGDVIFAADASGMVTYISPVAETLLGYKDTEVIGRSLAMLIGRQDLDAILTELEKGPVGHLKPQEHRVETKTGKILWMRTSSRPIIERGKILGFRGVIADVTERKLLESQLNQAQKMDAIGQLAGGIAHDFNNLLTGIMGYTDVLLGGADSEEMKHAGLLEIRNSSQRAAALTRQLLAFSRKQVLQPRVVDLNGLIAETEKMLQRLIGEDLMLTLALDPELGRVKADPGRIEQIILNLAINARDAMPRGGKLTIETMNVLLKEGSLQPDSELQPGSYVLLKVTDTGDGMAPEVQARLFEPFFTTKGIGKGTGLGLSTVYGIVKQSNGHIDVQSEVGQGTTFRVFFPRTQEEPTKTEARPAAPEPTGALGTVLLVEDNEAVAKVARQILESSGGIVLSAGSAEEALELSGRHPGAIGLLLTDVILPGLNGRELAERLMALHPEMKVVFMSGYTDDMILRRGGLGAGCAFLEKPFTREALFEKIQEARGREVSQD